MDIFTTQICAQNCAITQKFLEFESSFGMNSLYFCENYTKKCVFAQKFFGFVHAKKPIK